MSQINADKKLELLRQVRMEQHHNRNVLSNREQLLYGKTWPSSQPKGELYGLEAGAHAGTMPVKDDIFNGNMLKSFKLRLLISVILFVIYIIIDRNDLSIIGINSERILSLTRESFDELSGFFSDLFN